MGDRKLKEEEMATSSAAVTTVSTQVQEVQPPTPPVAVITLRQAPRTESRRRVIWAEDTVDNEHMNKKKSKCCCIYEKPRKFGESDSEDSDDECEHCFGHVEKRKQRPEDAQPSTSNDTSHSMASSRTVKILVKSPVTPDTIENQPTPPTAT